MKSLVKLIIGLLMSLFIIHANAQTFTNYTTTDGLPDNNVNGVAIDRNNNKWFGTQTGVAKFDNTSWTVFTTAQGIIDNYINSIAVDRANRIWVGTDIGVSMYDGSSWTSYTTVQGLVNNQVNYISADKQGNVWFATVGGLSVFNGTAWTSYTTTNGLPSDMASYITPDSLGNVWIGTWIGGLVKFNGTTFRTFTTNDSLTGNNIISIAIDSIGNKWIGTYGGISVFDDSDNWVRNYTTTDGLYNNFVQDIKIDSHGIIWTGMYADYLQDGGISKFSGTTWTSLGVTEGLIDVQVKRIAVDPLNNLWIATGSGVSKWNYSSTSVQNVNDKKEVIVYPNPANELIQVSHKGPVSIDILDLTGQTILSKDLQSSDNQINIHQVASGVYFFRIKTDNKSYCVKLIVK
jgi:ligand-binding sensor domain-containing protein